MVDLLVIMALVIVGGLVLLHLLPLLIVLFVFGLLSLPIALPIWIAVNLRKSSVDNKDKPKHNNRVG